MGPTLRQNVFKGRSLGLPVIKRCAEFHELVGEQFANARVGQYMTQRPRNLVVVARSARRELVDDQLCGSVEHTRRFKEVSDS